MQPTFISHKTDANKDYHQENEIHNFDLSNESNTRDGSDDVILMKKKESSDRQQKVKYTRFSLASEMYNDNATKDPNHTTEYSINSMEQYISEKEEQDQTEDKNYKEKDKSVRG